MGAFAFRPEEFPPGPFTTEPLVAPPEPPLATSAGPAPAGAAAGVPDPQAVLAAAEPWADGAGLWSGLTSAVGGVLRAVGVLPPVQPPRYGVPKGDDPLAGRFEIVDEVMRHHAPNQITQEEYDRVSAMYAAIAAGDSDLVIPEAMAPREKELSITTDARFERDDLRARMLNDIASLLQTENGRVLIDQLHDNYLKDEDGRALDPKTGQPLLEGVDPVHHKTTLFESLTGDDSAAYVDLPGVAGDPRKDPALSREIDAGLEAGEMFDASVGWKPGDDGSGIRSDVALFHELRHAYDFTTGNMNPGIVDAAEGPPIDAAKGVDLAESQAVGCGQTYGAGMNGGAAPLTENAYRAERARIAAALGVGIREGDIGMPQRPAYTL